ncbi:sugar ABC transporter substrate-binding protein [Roseateles microcysteis]|uniref:sugar ABC transporter substrate-binding protein n=1 Tax=Roseateles microcysteis TaxID=3119057 RepID=UPI002FE6A6F4
MTQASRPWTRRAWLGAAAAAPALLSACKPQDANTLRFWAMGREGEVAAELLAGFRAENPGVNLRIEALPWTAAHEKLLTAFAGDATPDVAQMGNTWLPEMAALGALEPLDDWLPRAPSLAPADYFEGIWQTNEVAASRVGVPWYVDTRLMYVRHDLLARAGFQKPPTDWAAWHRCLGALQASGVATPILLPTNEFEPLLALALQQGEPLLREGGRRGNFAGAGFTQALRFYLRLFADGYAPGISNNQVANLWQEFGRGSFAFYISGPWNIGEFKRRLPPELQGSWSTAPLPGPTGPGASIAGGASLVMFKRSSVKPLAWKLIEYLSRPAVQLQFYRLTGNLPPRRSSWALPMDGASLAQDRYAAAYAEQLERVRPAPAVPEWERIVQEMQLFAARAIHERSDVHSTARALDVRVDALLEKRRWMLDRGSRS